MRICVIIAPNDRYNYGDLLFSHVLKTKLGCYYNEFVDISTIDADLSVFGGHKVYSINKIKEHTKNRNFDVILAGGHSLFCPWPFVLFCLNNKYAWLSKFNILLSKLLDRNKSKSITNCISRLVFGAKTKYPYSIGKYEIDGIRKIIYNSVDGNLDATLNKEDKRLLKSIDYLSVRNNTTCNQLKENGIQVYSYPDSAIQISQIFPIVDLLKMTSINRDYFKKSYIVFQINRGLGERSFSAIVENIKQIINHYDYKIYLCPIGFAKGHDDLIILNRLYEYIGSDKLVLFNNLNIWDIMGLIANSQCFIGSSLHGCITAMSYCKPYLGVEVSKTLNYIKDWGLGEDYCSECTDFYMKLSNALSCTPEVLKNNLNFQLNKSNENFKNIEKILVD